MMMTTCPNCGKPLRAGARFCGSCGYTLPTRSAEPNLAPSSAPASSDCPQCGKPIRVGAKFCNHCGRELPAAPVLSDTQPSEAQTVRYSKLNSDRPMAAPAAFTPAPGKSGPAGQFASGRKRNMVSLAMIIGALVLLCALGSAGIYLFFEDPMNWRGTHQLSPTSVEPVGLLPTETASAEIEPSAAPLEATQLAPTIEETTLPSPILAPTETPFLLDTLTPTLGLTRSLEITGTLAPAILSPATMILEDAFDEALNIHWKAWGNPMPIIRSGFGDRWLDLSAADQSNRAGVTTRLEIQNSPGTTIEFEAQLNPTYPQYPLFLDWDPIQFDRGPENATPTVVRLEVRRQEIVLRASAANNLCRVDLEGLSKHHYVLRFLDDKLVELLIDDDASPLCQLDLGIIPVPGRISFTGNGWITRVLVTGSMLP